MLAKLHDLLDWEAGYGGQSEDFFGQMACCAAQAGFGECPDEGAGGGLYIGDAGEASLHFFETF